MNTILPILLMVCAIYIATKLLKRAGRNNMYVQYRYLQNNIESMSWREANQAIADFHYTFDDYPECQEMAAVLREIISPMGYESAGSK